MQNVFHLRDKKKLFLNSTLHTTLLYYYYVYEHKETITFPTKLERKE